MRKWPFLLVLLVAAACSKEGSPALPVSKTTSTTAPAGVAGGSSTSQVSPTSIATSTTTPKGPGIAMTGPTGSGTLTWSVDTGREEFCYRISIKDVGTAKSASLRHTEGSDVVLTLLAPGADGSVNTCTPSDSITVQQLQSSPRDFFVEVVADKGTLKATLK